ncbi:MAG TPA: hypothetical protein VLD18_01470 [Verrucomicrobiae bacterium]|nr:hypothetical protein [Verrucomicrobiae bacterium]
MKVLVTFAAAAEFTAWRTARPFHCVGSGSLSLYEARVGGSDVTVALTGVGPFPAIGVARRLLERRPDVCISSGFAGGLRPQHAIGDLLVARALRMDDERFLLRTDDRLRRLAAVCGARAVDLFYSSERVVVTAREKVSLGLVADAVEMESYAILTEAARCCIPAVVVRAVSDTVHEDLPLDFNRVLDRGGRVSFPRLLGQVARRPDRLPKLIRMGAESRRAAASLAGFLDEYIPMLTGKLTDHARAARVAAR